MGRVLIDNWTLQDAGALLDGQLSGGTTHEIVFSADGESFRYVEVLESAIALECLCELLHNVVFTDELVVDADFTKSWEEHASIALLERECIVKRKPLNDAKGEWLEWRRAMEDQLSFCPQLRQQHQENKRQYAETNEAVDPMLSQVVWGGAGMLARAHYLRVPYVGHPLRQRVLARARVLLGPTDAGSQLRSFVESQRSKLFERIDSSGFFAELRLPPVIVEIVNSASSLSDLVPAALELRMAYRELRAWVSQLQAALDDEEVREVLSRRKVLESVIRHIDQLSNARSSGDTSMRLGVGWLNVTKNLGSPLNWVNNKLGVRAQINRLILLPPGRSCLEKLLGLLGEQDRRSMFQKFMATHGG